MDHNHLNFIKNKVQVYSLHIFKRLGFVDYNKGGRDPISNTSFYVTENDEFVSRSSKGFVRIKNLSDLSDIDDLFKAYIINVLVHRFFMALLHKIKESRSENN